MAYVLIVDDSPEQALIVSGLLESSGHETRIAADGRAALDAIAETRPDLVVTDLIMPGINGLELVESATKIAPSLPVILMTAFGSGEIAMQALEKGAASYVPKRLLDDQLVETVENILAMTQARHERERLLQSLDEYEYRFVLENDPAMIAPLVSYIQDCLVAHGAVGETDLMQIGLALHEALSNAIHHGNLGVSSAVRDRSFQEYNDAIERRRKESPYGDRRVHLRVVFGGGEMRSVLRDEGEGFDVSTVPDPRDPENLLLAHGRGLYLIGTFMNEVHFNDTGNEITMVKRLDGHEQG